MTAKILGTEQLQDADEVPLWEKLFNLSDRTVEDVCYKWLAGMRFWRYEVNVQHYQGTWHRFRRVLALARLSDPGDAPPEWGLR